jgi:hypothetical protein
MSNEDTVRRYFTAVAGRDHATAEGLRHPGWVCDWPQSGERVTSSASMRAIVEQYPGGGWESRERRLWGSEDEFVLTPAGTLVRVAGAGEVWTAEWMNRYPDGSEWFVIGIVQLRDGKVFREATYWAPPFEAPEWRRPWVELETS